MAAILLMEPFSGTATALVITLFCLLLSIMAGKVVSDHAQELADLLKQVNELEDIIYHNTAQ